MVFILFPTPFCLLFPLAKWHASSNVFMLNKLKLFASYCAVVILKRRISECEMSFLLLAELMEQLYGVFNILPTYKIGSF